MMRVFRLMLTKLCSFLPDQNLPAPPCPARRSQSSSRRRSRAETKSTTQTIKAAFGLKCSQWRGLDFARHRLRSPQDTIPHFREVTVPHTILSTTVDGSSRREAFASEHSRSPPSEASGLVEDGRAHQIERSRRPDIVLLHPTTEQFAAISTHSNTSFHPQVILSPSGVPSIDTGHQ